MHFIKLGNDLAALQNITPEELYVYCYLYQWQRLGHKVVRTSIYILSKHIHILKTSAANKNRIKNNLQLLQGKKLISCTGNDLALDIKLEQDWSDCFTLIPSVLYERADNAYEWAIICYTLRWSSFKSRISYMEYSVALGCTHKTTINTIKKMANKGLIGIERGQYINLQHDKKQRVNRYHVVGGSCGETAAHELVGVQGYALMNGDQRIVGDDDIKHVAKIFYEKDRAIVSRDVVNYNIDKKRQLIDQIKRAKLD